jgi:hypothetical protein
VKAIYLSKKMNLIELTITSVTGNAIPLGENLKQIKQALATVTIGTRLVQKSENVIVSVRGAI